MSLQTLVVEYVTYLRGRNVAQSTIKSYASRIRALDRWLSQSGATPTVVDFNLPVLDRYMNHRVAEGDRPRTRASAIDSFRNFGEWLVEKGHAPDNPARALVKPKLDAAERAHITDEEVEEFLAACDHLPGERRSIMAKAVVSILAFTIIRRSELLNLEVRDVVLSGDKRALIVRHGKGEKSRILPLVSEPYAAIHAWLAVRGTCRHPFLFDIDGSRRMGDQGLRTLLLDVAACAGHRNAPNFKPHSLRHNGADRMHRNGAPLRDVQAMLGHGRIATTERYLRDGSTHLFEIADAVMGFRTAHNDQQPTVIPSSPAPVRPPAPPEPNQRWRIRVNTRR